MNYTNLSNLPGPLVSAILNDDYDAGGADITPSGMIQPPRMRQLMKRHDHELLEDVSEGIWRLIGKIGHKIVERADTDNHLAEERLYTTLHGWKISGQADLLGPDMILDDFKFTSVFAVKGLKTEWEQQLNLYAWLYRENGFTVKAARIVAVLRDWSKAKASREQDYPPVGVVVKEVRLWEPLEQEDVASVLVRKHQHAESLADDDLPMCTDEERWKRPGKFAVTKKGNKRASKLFDDEVSAAAMAVATGYEVVRRPDVYPRCELYCPVKSFCSFGKTLMPVEEEAA